ncbi:MAG: DUF2191 domain-containing protein [Gemmatimonadota bacterium]|jgi:hypothetical protein
MRTTLTLDEDVAATLGRVREKRNLTLKEAVNEALRRGLREMEEGSPVRQVYSTEPVSMGGFLIGNLDDVAEALALAEGENFR